ncbi:MAG: glycerol-3-phosphate dehydrogenase/oxidase, partial [Sphingobacteriaceae bacterium]
MDINNTYKREALLGAIEATPQWDVLVIGGGASGLGIALDATLRGYKTLLVEQSDFAKGTSSRSTKLVHGGVRYLAQGNIKLVREASIERGLLRKNAPHLVKDQTFIVPVYNWWDKIKYTIGLKLYDAIAGKLSLGPSVFISRKKVLAQMPGIKSSNLQGGVLYHDGQFDDARLAINIAQSIIDEGGGAINYMQLTALHKNDKGILHAATIKDVEQNKTYQINAQAIINATGIFVDDILMMDNARAQKTICVSQGVHVVLDKKFLHSAHALMIPKTSDGRVLFAVPWYNKLVVGTTDTPVEKVLLEPVALDEEIDFILETAAAYLTAKPTRKDVLSVFAGLRPLAALQAGHQKTKEISRSHKITVSASKLFTMLGGKWTTYRKMAEDMMNKVEQELEWSHRSSATANHNIHGYTTAVDTDDPLHFYGSHAEMLQQKINDTGNIYISESLKINTAQIAWAIENEMARTVEDFLSRRTRAIFLDAMEARRIAPDVAGIMATILDK